MAHQTEKRELARRETGSIFRQEKELSIAALERALLKTFPAEDAEAWDRTGLIVGNPHAQVVGVAVALDPTTTAIQQATELGANVLLTHHPAFLQPPTSFSPLKTSKDYAGSLVWEAISLNVALMAFHTTLDVNPSGSAVLPGMLGLEAGAVLHPYAGTPNKGFGRVCSIHPSDALLTVSHLAARCTAIFGRPPRVWGNFSQELTTIAVCSGSASGMIEDCLHAHAECLVCGELKYHDALACAEQGLAIIELGHDVSELPYVASLMSAAEHAGVPKEALSAIDQSGNWMHPESVRV